MKNIIGLIAILVLIGCTTTQKGTTAGTVAGAGIGGIIGHQSGHGAEGAAIGGVIGALGGYIVGDKIEENQIDADPVEEEAAEGDDE